MAFIPYSVPNARLTPQDMGVPDLLSSIQKGFQTANMPKQLAADLLAKQLQNKINQPKADYAKDITLADLAQTQAQTGLIGAQTGAIPSEIDNRVANTLKQNILNKWLPQREQAEIGEIGERAKYYGAGGGRGSTGSKDYMQFESGVQADNPQLTPEQLREATTVIARGGNQLSDGTSLNKPSFQTQAALDRAVKATTTSAQINSNLDAHQAESEITVLQDYATKGLAPYGNTYGNYSPSQVIDSMKLAEPDQKKLGRLIAAQALQYEIAQQRIKLSKGQPGVTSTQELMELSKQNINPVFPKLSQEARSEAARYMDEALKAGLKARDKIGIGAGNTYKFSSQANDNTANYADKLKNSISPVSQSLIIKWNDAHPAEADRISINQITQEAQIMGVDPDEYLQVLFKKRGL